MFSQPWVALWVFFQFSSTAWKHPFDDSNLSAEVNVTLCGICVSVTDVMDWLTFIPSQSADISSRPLRSRTRSNCIQERWNCFSQNLLSSEWLICHISFIKLTMIKPNSIWFYSRHYRLIISLTCFNTRIEYIYWLQYNMIFLIMYSLVYRVVQLLLPFKKFISTEGIDPCQTAMSLQTTRYIKHLLHFSWVLGPLQVLLHSWNEVGGYK